MSILYFPCEDFASVLHSSESDVHPQDLVCSLYTDNRSIVIILKGHVFQIATKEAHFSVNDPHLQDWQHETNYFELIWTNCTQKYAVKHFTYILKCFGIQ